jgi:hypothetical protein
MQIGIARSACGGGLSPDGFGTLKQTAVFMAVLEADEMVPEGL